ncbi:uncharacterized protein [Lolium perenne]|uniref:uncharacterized protein n=1 Tax=Lolium perenne TaxID=4522 RepID=UPI0021F58313|nr:uncharacterized protein LOC127330612 [Lolium perenne]
MGRSKGATAPKINGEAPRPCPSLIPDLLSNIHDRLGFLDRVAFAAVFASSCDDDLFKPHAPWLVFPRNTPETVELFTIADQRGATVPAPAPALRDHVIVGSARGWLATADARGQIYLVNPATGEQHELPHIATTGVFLPSAKYHHFSLVMEPFLTIRYGHGPPFNHCWVNTHTWDNSLMRTQFYRKVVLSSSSPRPGAYEAMLLWRRELGAPAFASAEDPSWSLARSPEGVEDAIHHDGQFYSVSYAGLVEAWERDAGSGEYTSTAVAPRLLAVEEHKQEDGEPSCRKYLAAAPGGRLMVVIKYYYYAELQGRRSWSCSFKVHVLGDDGQWKERTDVGDLALFVGMNNSLCLPTTGRPQIEAGCVYYTGDELGSLEARKGSLSSHSYGSRDGSDLRAVGVYSLKDGTLKKMEALGKEQRSFYPPPAWITPSVP